MKIIFALALSVCLLSAQHAMPTMGKITAQKRDGYGQLHFTVTSASEEAKAWANQGLRLCYAFNHPEAIANFEKAISLDPSCAMCYWGLAFAQGNNINQPLMPEYAKPAYDNAQKALALAKSGSTKSAKATPREKALIAALAQRYAPENPTDRFPLDYAYAVAMRQVAKDYPDDLDAQVLAADALMNLTPWKLWDRDGKPNAYTEEIVAKLEAVLQRDPNHTGANHLYIHAVEASPTPERALRSADILGNLANASGHLVHMPAHIYMRTGDYESAARVNIAAAELDRQYFASIGGPSYYTPYWVHNLHFLAAARAMQGNYAEASAAIWQAAKRMEPVARMNQGFEAFLAMPYFVEVRFQQWEKILAFPAPASFSLSVENSWHWARAMAYAAKGDLEKARAEQALFASGVARFHADRSWGLNKETAVMQIALFALEAKILAAAGQRPEAIVRLRSAVAAEEALAYDEPAGWYYPPMREGLGALLLADNQPVEAENVFRQELAHNRRNPRALFGLYTALFAQGRMEESEMVRPLFESAWAKADFPLTLKRLF